MAPFCCRIGLFLLAITSLSACPDKPTPVKNRVVDQRPKPLALSREQALLRIQRKEWRRTRADRWLYDQLRSDDPLLRARAVIALGYLGDLRELSPLWALLRDPNRGFVAQPLSRCKPTSSDAYFRTKISSERCKKRCKPRWSTNATDRRCRSFYAAWDALAR
jgi:hypothetical protein